MDCIFDVVFHITAIGTSYDSCISFALLMPEIVTFFALYFSGDDSERVSVCGSLFLIMKHVYFDFYPQWNETHGENFVLCFAFFYRYQE